VTDGTSAGTSELAVAGADSGVLFDLSFFSSGFSPGFTVLGTRVLFEGYDASGIDSLWVADGTSAGTSELAVAGSFANGVFFDINAPDLTVFAGKALFAGADTNGNIGLWITDAMGAGTSELTVGGSNPNGLFFNAHRAAADLRIRDRIAGAMRYTISVRPRCAASICSSKVPAPLSQKLMIKKINFS
jgi:hypothetical protein